jgi:hypothetical protein
LAVFFVEGLGLLTDLGITKESVVASGFCFGVCFFEAGFVLPPALRFAGAGVAGGLDICSEIFSFSELMLAVFAAAPRVAQVDMMIFTWLESDLDIVKCQ